MTVVSERRTPRSSVKSTVTDADASGTTTARAPSEKPAAAAVTT